MNWTDLFPNLKLAADP